VGRTNGEEKRTLRHVGTKESMLDESAHSTRAVDGTTLPYLLDE